MSINSFIFITATTYFVCFFIIWKIYKNNFDDLKKQRKQWLQRHVSGKTEGICVSIVEQKVISTNPRALPHVGSQ